MRDFQILEGDCFEKAKDLKSNSIDLIYLDPPFYTQKEQKLSPRDRSVEYSFKDLWVSMDDYGKFLFDRIKEFHRILKPEGSIYFHCDRNASHLARFILEEVFGKENFQAEIIWFYKRWSNAKKGLLSCHQNIFFFSKTGEFKFNTKFTEYSETTNLDQILQKRIRDEANKSVYAKDQNGEVLINASKKGVPLGDVWEIPYLNPKAKERIGYPTQKPILLLERIIEISSNQGDIVLDPFCGSGTTLVAAKLLKRQGIGIDISPEAIKITKERLFTPLKSESQLLNLGRKAYKNADEEALKFLSGVEYFPIQRNNGIDAILRKEIDGKPILVRIQKLDETISECLCQLRNAMKSKQAAFGILIKTNTNTLFEEELEKPENVFIFGSPSIQINEFLKSLEKETKQKPFSECSFNH